MKFITKEQLEQIENARKYAQTVIGDKWKATNQLGSIEGNVTYGSGNNMKKRTFTMIGPNAIQPHQVELWLKALVEYVIAVDPHTMNNLLCEIKELEQREQNALKEAEHWKANHECEVSRARVLKERPDMPLERVKAYDRMVELEKENEALKQRIASLEDVEQTRMILQMIHSMVIDTQQMSREQLCYWQTHFRNPNGW